MKTIQLGGQKAAGRVVLVDDEDYELMTQYRWHVRETAASGNRKASGPYALTNIHREGRRTSALMHTLLTGWPLVDHINHNGLDNRRENLRPATRSQNLQNMTGRSNRRWRFKGIEKPSRGRQWKAYIKVDGRLRHLGYFATDEEAARAYDAAAREAFGPYACLNFPD